MKKKHPLRNPILKFVAASIFFSLDPGSSFLSMDEKPDRRGNGRGMKSVPNGIIHDWVGTDFIPNTPLDQFLALVADDNHYMDIYKPNLVDSRVLTWSHEVDRFSMRLLAEVSLNQMRNALCPGPTDVRHCFYE